MKHTKLIRIAYYGTAMAMLCSTTAFAYVDPSVMTYMIQIIAGVVVAVGAVAGVLWRKAKKKVSNKLGIDENRNKEVESDEISVSDKK